ncbi:MAG: AAA family ATPase [Limnohabitans sp.]|nr:AAA family ATPase [Limnohabitans sp.]
MTIKIENTKDKINEVGHTCLFYGQSGNGKTTFASTAKDVLFLDTENSTKGLGSRNIYVDVIDFKRFPNKDNMHELKEIEDIVKQKKYKTIVIDTIDMLVDSMTNDKQLFFKDSERQSDGSLTQKGYGALSRKLKNFIRSFVDCDIDVILLCHEKEVKDINGVNIGIKPALPASLNNFIFSRVETVGLIKSIINPKTKQQEVCVSVEPTGDATSGKDRMGNIAA